MPSPDRARVRPVRTTATGTPPARHNEAGERLAARSPQGARRPASWPRSRGPAAPWTGRAVRAARRAPPPQEPPPPRPREAADRDRPGARDHPRRRRGGRGQPLRRQPLPRGGLHAQVAAPDRARARTRSSSRRTARCSARSRRRRTASRSSSVRSRRGSPKGTVAIEDRRFYQHGGLDYQGIARAAWTDLRAGRIVEGGSTITQELVRNLYIGNSERTFSRKLKEACLANKLADVWTKNQILAAYLNEVFYGQHAYGAAGGRADVLLAAGEPADAAAGGAARRPAAVADGLRPVRATRVLHGSAGTTCCARCSRHGVHHAGRVPAGDARGARLKPGSLYSTSAHPNFFGWAETQLDRAVRREARRGGRPPGADDDRSAHAVRRRSTAMASSCARRPTRRRRSSRSTRATGAVRAMVNYLPSGRKLQVQHRDAGRPPGGQSSFKPFTLATALERGHLAPDRPSRAAVADDPRPAVRVQRRAVGRPQLRGRVRGLHEPARGDRALGEHDLRAARRQGRRRRRSCDDGAPDGHPSPLQPVCSITLGTQAVNPLEMTDAYATLAARGIHHAPQAFEIVRGPSGGVLGKLDDAGARAMPAERRPTRSTYALQGVVTHGTGTAASLRTGRRRARRAPPRTSSTPGSAATCRSSPTCVWVGYPKARSR